MVPAWLTWRCPAGDWAGAILLGLQARDTVAALGGGSPARGGRPPADLEDAAGAAGAWAVNARGVEANALPGQIVGCVKVGAARHMLPFGC